MGQLLKKDKRPPVKIQLKKNDQVKVIAGKDKGKTGRILNVDSASGRIMVEQINIVKKHTRKNPAKQIAGGVAASVVTTVCLIRTAPHLLQTIITLETAIEASDSATPPAICLAGFFRVCFLTMLICSTMTRPEAESTFKIRPVLPLSLPAMTLTWSFFFS